MLSLKQLPREVSSASFEASVFSELVKHPVAHPLHYWRTQDGKEISFILDAEGPPVPLAVEMNIVRLKYTALRYFNRTYSPARNLCTHLYGHSQGKEPGVRGVFPWDIMYQMKRGL